jgi:hypothetical protein
MGKGDRGVRRMGAAMACLLGLAGCAALEEQDEAYQVEQAQQRETYCTSAGYTPGTDAHRMCQQIEALNQRLERVERRMDRVELAPYPYNPRYRYWP